MKNLTCIFILMFCFGSVFGQIGIYTDNPLSILHIDAAKDNSASPTPAQILNDVVVTSAGDLGIGTLNPATKVEIANTGNGGSPLLRIVDGSTMAAKVLESDANGVAAWTAQPVSYVKSYRGATYGQGFVNRQNTILTLNEPIIIPQNGEYLLTIRWWGFARRDFPLRNIQSAYIYAKLKATGASLDQIEYYLVGTIGSQLVFTTSLYLGNRTAGDEIEIAINPTIGGDSGTNPFHWQLNATTTRPDLLPQIIVYSI